MFLDLLSQEWLSASAMVILSAGVWLRPKLRVAGVAGCVMLVAALLQMLQFYWNSVVFVGKPQIFGLVLVALVHWVPAGFGFALASWAIIAFRSKRIIASTGK
jgi:hypothetical protein